MAGARGLVKIRECVRGPARPAARKVQNMYWFTGYIDYPTVGVDTAVFAAIALANVRLNQLASAAAVVTDEASGIAVYPALNADPVLMTDVTQGIFEYDDTQTETAQMSDSAEFDPLTISKVVSDGMVIGTAILHNKLTYPIEVEAVNFSDQAEAGILFDRSLFDTATVTEQVAVLLQVPRLLIDGVDVNAVVAVDRTTSPASSDSLTATDTAFAARAVYGQAAENLVASDSIAYVVAISAASVDNSTVTDTLVDNVISQPDLTEDGSVTDAADGFIVAERVLSDTMTASDVVALIVAIPRTVTETASISIDMSFTIAVLRTEIETVQMADVVEPSAVSVRTATDSIQIADTTSSFIAIGVVGADTGTVTDLTEYLYRQAGLRFDWERNSQYVPLMF